jgi:23S rRNA (adenine2503-C2)-methyltransferase
MEFYRNLESWEIIEQFLAIQRLLKVSISNVVIMGMGEPLLNYEAVIRACHLLNHPDGPAVGHRKIVISTSGIVPQIQRFATEHQPFKLAISLNAATDAQRCQIMPIARKYPIAELMAAARDYARLSRLRVTFEYVLLAGFNDQPKDATNLKNLVHGLPCKINLIPYNNIQNPGQVPDNAAVNQFFSYFKDFPAIVSVRWSKGTDIQAACGQLVVRDRIPLEKPSEFCD